MVPIIENLRQTLSDNSNEQLKISTQHFFKEGVKCYGIKSATVGTIGKEYFKAIKELSKAQIFGLCDELWQSGYIEESIIASHWSYNLNKKFEPADFKVFEKWINSYVNNWASCDTFCNHTVGKFIEMYPTYLNDLKQWTQSDNRWMKRAAAVSLIVPAREGRFLKEIFEIADILLLDGDDMVQKGYGWMLKVASKKHQEAVFEYVVANKAVMPRTALRYAIEKMPSELKKLAMAK
jgi:3-methyladenine DNA glycosylase AlkD